MANINRQKIHDVKSVKNPTFWKESDILIRKSTWNLFDGENDTHLLVKKAEFRSVKKYKLDIPEIYGVM